MLEKGKVSEELLSTEWEKFKVQHGKEYKSSDEADYRRQVFRNNFQFIYSHNVRHFHPAPRHPHTTYYLDVNEYADLTN